MTSYTTPLRPSPLPLILAGAAFILTAWLVADRVGFFTPGPKGEPRVITPRGELADYEKDTILIFEENSPSVAHITTLVEEGNSYWGRQTYQDGTGSGFVWDEAGTIVTNYHVVRSVIEETGRRHIRVALEEGTFVALPVGASPEQDIAILRLQDPPPNLRPIPLGTSADLQVGQAIFVIGNPFGLDHTLTTGVISALDRTIPTENKGELRNAIQVDAAINPGNSGGPVLDSAGRLIGMATAILSPSGSSAGIGFAVPVDTVNEIVPDLIAGRSSQHVLGITSMSDIVYRLDPSTGYRSGIVVTGLTPGYGAEAAGIQPFVLEERGNQIEIREYGDLIVEVDGKPVPRFGDLQAVLRGRHDGEIVPVKVLRGRELRPVVVNVELKRSVM